MQGLSQDDGVHGPLASLARRQGSCTCYHFDEKQVGGLTEVPEKLAPACCPADVATVTRGSVGGQSLMVVSGPFVQHARGQDDMDSPSGWPAPAPTPVIPAGGVAPHHYLTC